MISAFGVDHGGTEISKLGLGGATKIARLGPVAGGITHGLGQAGGAIGGAVGGAGIKMARAGKTNLGAAKIAGKGRGAMGVKALGTAQQKVGAGMNRAGTLALRKPALTGGLAAGGVAGGVGGAGFGLGNRRRQ